jgi:hypothetical protein
MPNRAIIELHCQRIVQDTAYNGEVILRSEPGESPVQNLNLKFSKRELQDVAVWMHHLVRLLADAGVEFCVRMFQKAPNNTRPPVAMDIDATQVNKIYESVESAQLYFAPMFRVRKEGPTNVIK